MAASHAESSMTEALFRPTTRFRDSYPNHGYRLPVGYRYNEGRLPRMYTEVELLPGLTVEHVLATCTTWEDYRRFAHEKVVWMTTHVFVCSQHITGTVHHSVLMLGDDDDIQTWLRVGVVQGTAAAAATATCDLLLRLLATSRHPAVHIRAINEEVPPPLSGAGLSLFFQEIQSCLRKVTFQRMALNADHIQALATVSRETLQVILLQCSLYGGTDCKNAFVECLQSDRGPTELIMCRIEGHVLANALTGNSRVTKLQLDYRRTASYAAGNGAIFSVLANNKGLKELHLNRSLINDENWAVLCESLSTHPTLASLHVRSTCPTRAILPDERQKAHRTRVLAEMVKRNTVLYTINLSDGERDGQIYTDEVLPRLETNFYRPRVLAISKAEISLRRPFLGLALQTESVRNDSNQLWMFLSGNTDVVLPSDEDIVHKS